MARSVRAGTRGSPPPRARGRGDRAGPRLPVPGVSRFPGPPAPLPSRSRRRAARARPGAGLGPWRWGVRRGARIPGFGPGGAVGWLDGGGEAGRLSPRRGVACGRPPPVAGAGPRARGGRRTWRCLPETGRRPGPRGGRPVCLGRWDPRVVSPAARLRPRPFLGGPPLAASPRPSSGGAGVSPRVLRPSARCPGGVLCRPSPEKPRTLCHTRVSPPDPPPPPASRALGKVAGVPRARGALGKRSRGAAAGPCVVGEKEGGALPCPGGRSRRRRVGAGPPRGRAAFDGRRSSLWVPRDRPCAGRPSGGETPRAPRRNRLASPLPFLLSFLAERPLRAPRGSPAFNPRPAVAAPAPPPQLGGRPVSSAASRPAPSPGPPRSRGRLAPRASRRGPRRRRCVRAATVPVPLPRGRAFPARRPGPRPGGRREPASPRAAPPGGGGSPGPRAPDPSPGGPALREPARPSTRPPVSRSRGAVGRCRSARGRGRPRAAPPRPPRGRRRGVSRPLGSFPPTPPAAWCRAGVLWGGRFSGGPARPPASPCPLRTRAPCSAPRARHTSGPPPLSVCARSLPG